MDNKRIEKWKLKAKGIFHKITYDEFWFYIDDLMKENKQLQDNWNELRKYIRATKIKEFEKTYGKRIGKTFIQAEIIVCNMIIEKMEELEKGDSND